MTRSMEEFRQKERHEWVEDLNERVDVPECNVLLSFRIIHPHSQPRWGPILYICTSIRLFASAFHSSTPIVELQ